MKLPGGAVEFVNGPVDIGTELKDIGPGPVGTRVPVDPDIVGTVALDNGKGAEVLLALNVAVPVGLVIVDRDVERDEEKGTEDIGINGLLLEPEGCPVPVGPAIDEVELVMGKGAVWELLKLCADWPPLGIIDPDAVPDGVGVDRPVGPVVIPVCPPDEAVALDNGNGGDD